jgi:hypothetical protein
VRDLIWNQRRAYLQLMRMLREAQSEINAEDDPFTVLLIEGGILHVEADLHWLDRCEETLEAKPGFDTALGAYSTGELFNS